MNRIDEKDIIKKVKDKLQTNGFDDRQMLENFQLNVKGRNLHFDLVVLSSDNRKIIVFEIKKFTRINSSQLAQLYDYLLESEQFTSIQLFTIDDSYNVNLFLSNELENRKSNITIPRRKDWDNTFIPETKIFHFKGTRDVSLLALTSYLVATTQNYFKFLNLNKLLELYILGDIKDSQVYLSKSTKYNYYYESITDDFEYARSSVILGNKSHAELFWTDFIKLSNPMFLIERNGRLTPIFDFKSSDLKIKRIEVNSPPLIDVEGIANAGISLWYAQDRRAEEHEIHTLRVRQLELQNENLELQNETLRIMKDRMRNGEISRQEVLDRTNELSNSPLIGYVNNAKQAISLHQNKTNERYDIYLESIDIRV